MMRRLTVLVSIFSLLAGFTGWYYTQHAAEPKALANNKTGVNIVFNAVPKSASEYIVKTLELGLDYTFTPISSGYIPTDQIIIERMSQFNTVGSRITKQHFDASPLNIQIFKRYNNKLVLHLRDPREVLLSWVHHVNRLMADGTGVYFFMVEPPVEYFKLSLAQQIDVNIDTFLPQMVNWMQSWLALKEQEDKKSDGLQILVTTYDEFKSNEQEFYYKILDFYNISYEKFAFAPPHKDAKVFFRSGEQNEWRTVFSEQQKQRIAEIVPEKLLAKFNWKP